MRRIAVVVAAVVVVLVALLVVRLRIQSAELHAPPGGSGEIEGTNVDLSARITARVAELPVKKGSSVKAGAVVVRLDCSDQLAALSEAEARLAAARAQAAAAVASVEAARRTQEAALASRSAARAQADALVPQRDAALRQAKRFEALPEDVSVSNRDQTRASAEALARQVEAADAQAKASVEQAHAAEVAIAASRAQAAAAEANVKAADDAARRSRLLAEECVLVAPRDAMLDDLPREVGELVPAGAPVAKLVDLAEVKATFYLPNAEVAAARPGQRAVVVADAYPGRKFEGVVATVSVKAEFTPRNIQTRTDRDRLVYPVEVRVKNPDGALRPGMPVQVTLPRGG
ncbi:MAG TPA: HlyD family efflux transporter periplasmic adaptor subunit [Anaeromyxobacteraceae bacterium]|nr:HlyD family efflux transporter periplasmic adaptor subunit [Anaeromyxobacteraceae bacterium]